MTQDAQTDRCIDFIAAAIQVPRFLIVRASGPQGDCMLADTMFDIVLRNWLNPAVSSMPALQTNQFADSLASALRVNIEGDEQLAMQMKARGYRTKSWVSGLHFQTMMSWMQATGVSEIVQLVARWLRLTNAEEEIDGVANVPGENEIEEGAGRLAALAWQVIQNSALGLSFCAAHKRALALLSIADVVDGRCGHR